MPDLYRIRCENCDWSAVQTFEGEQSDQITDGFDKLVLDDKAVALAFFKSYTLAEHGYTRERAESENRLVHVMSVICLTCGEFSELEINHTEMKLWEQDPKKRKAWAKSISCRHCRSSPVISLFNARDKMLLCPKCKSPSVKCNRESHYD